jgi:zinc transport system substrate-binding protein
MMELNRILKEHPANWMIWEGGTDKGIGQRLQAVGIDSLVFAPGGNKPAQGDF